MDVLRNVKAWADQLEEIEEIPDVEARTILSHTWFKAIPLNKPIIRDAMDQISFIRCQRFCDDLQRLAVRYDPIAFIPTPEHNEFHERLEALTEYAHTILREHDATLHDATHTKKDTMVYGICAGVVTVFTLVFVVLWNVLRV